MVQTSRLAASLVGLLGFAGLGPAAPLDGRAPKELTGEYCQAAAEQHWYMPAERNRGKNKDKREPKTNGLHLPASYGGIDLLDCDEARALDIKLDRCEEEGKDKDKDKREPKTEEAEWLDPQELCERGPLEYWWCDPLEQPEKRAPKGGPDLSELQELCDNGDNEDWWCKKLPKRDDRTLDKVALASPKGNDEDEDE